MKCTDRELTRQERRMQIRRRQRRKALSFLLLLICLIVLIGFIVFYFLFRSHEISFTNPYDMSSQVYGVLETPQKSQRRNPLQKTFVLLPEMLLLKMRIFRLQRLARLWI
ncbi:hypothetical protein DXA98_08495 [Lachnospiraceae bacterium OF09-6]|nr:hypothetical protein DXA98_08495 [Lachnospiraceae bacterium OF09-6]